MAEPDDWALAFARQARADFRAWELYEQYPEAVAAECHKLLFLQMACEKLCKAHLIRAGAQPQHLQASHGYTAKHLPSVVRREIVDSGIDPGKMKGVMALVRHLAGEIELLNPSVRRGVSVRTTANTLGRPGTRSSRRWTGPSIPCDWSPSVAGRRSSSS